MPKKDHPIIEEIEKIISKTPSISRLNSELEEWIKEIALSEHNAKSKVNKLDEIIDLIERGINTSEPAQQMELIGLFNAFSFQRTIASYQNC